MKGARLADDRHGLFISSSQLMIVLVEVNPDSCIVKADCLSKGRKQQQNSSHCILYLGPIKFNGRMMTRCSQSRWVGVAVRSPPIADDGSYSKLESRPTTDCRCHPSPEKQQSRLRVYLGG